MAMTEAEYIKATNRVKVSAALTIMRDVLAGNDYGISPAERSAIIILMCNAEEKLFSMIDISGGE